MNNRVLHPLRATATLALSAFLLAGCGKKADPAPTAPPERITSTATGSVLIKKAGEIASNQVNRATAPTP